MEAHLKVLEATIKQVRTELSEVEKTNPQIKGLVDRGIMGLIYQYCMFQANRVLGHVAHIIPPKVGENFPQDIGMAWGFCSIVSLVMAMDPPNDPDEFLRRLVEAHKQFNTEDPKIILPENQTKQ